MRKSLMVAFLVVAGLTSIIGHAQTGTPTPAPIPLRFEILKAGTKIATIAASVTAGSTGRIELDGIGSLTFTPAKRADSVEIVFTVTASGQVVHPRMVLRDGAQGVILLESEAGESVEARVSSGPESSR